MKSEDFDQLFAGAKFPRLKHLGLVDCDISDEIVYDLAYSKLIKQIETLDLSFGSLTDEGAEVLLNSPNILSLDHLNLHSNYLSPEFIKKDSTIRNVDFGKQKQE